MQATSSNGQHPEASGAPNQGRRFTVPLLCILAAGGWGWAFTLYRAPQNAGTTAGPAAPSLRQHTPDRAEREPSTTTSLARELPTNRSARLYSKMAAIIEGAVPGQVNPKLIAAANEALRDPDHVRRQRDLTLLLDLMRPDDAVAMHETFAALHREGLAFAPEYAAFATRWGEVDAPAALKYLGGDDPSRIPSHDFNNIALGWGKAAPLAALDWMKNHAGLADQRGSWQAVLSGWMEVDAQGATAELLRHPLSPAQTASLVTRATRLQLFNSGLESTVDWLANLPEDEVFGPAASQAWKTTMPALEELPYQNAAAVWNRLADRDWMDFQQFKTFAETIGRGRSKDQGTEGFYLAVGTTWPQERIHETFSRWTNDQPDQVLAWLAQLPPGPLASAVAEGARAAGYDTPD